MADKAKQLEWSDRAAQWLIDLETMDPPDYDLDILVPVLSEEAQIAAVTMGLSALHSGGPQRPDADHSPKATAVSQSPDYGTKIPSNTTDLAMWTTAADRQYHVSTTAPNISLALNETPYRPLSGAAKRLDETFNHCFDITRASDYVGDDKAPTHAVEQFLRDTTVMLIAFGDFVACVTPLLAQALRAIEIRLNDADDTEAVQAIHSAMTQLMAAFQVITTVEKAWKTKTGGEIKSAISSYSKEREMKASKSQARLRKYGMTLPRWVGLAMVLGGGVAGFAGCPDPSQVALATGASLWGVASVFDHYVDRVVGAQTKLEQDAKTSNALQPHVKCLTNVLETFRNEIKQASKLTDLHLTAADLGRGLDTFKTLKPEFEGLHQVLLGWKVINIRTSQL